MSGGRPAPRPRVVLLFGNTIEHNSRAMRMAGSLAAAGAEVLLVGRAAPGLPLREPRGDHEILRIPAPRGPRWLPAPRLPAAGPPPQPPAPARRVPARVHGLFARGQGLFARGQGLFARGQGLFARGQGLFARGRGLLREGPGRLAQAVRYLLLSGSWASAVERAVPDAAAWQADGLVMLPVALRLRKRRGGRVVYDSLEIHVESGRFAGLPGPWRRILAYRERRWARSADAVITVSRAYANVLAPRLGLVPAVVMNCPPAPAAPGWTSAEGADAADAADGVDAEGVERHAAPEPARRPRRLHALLGLPTDVPIVLYHGYLFPHRGIERLFHAMGDVPGAHLVIMGLGPRFDAYASTAAALPWADRVHVIPGVAPSELLEWVASADVAAMPIEGNTLNHRLTTPNKLFEAMSAGVPVVASALPGMAAIIRETRAGVLCDPNDERDVARAIRSILDASPEERAAYRERALAAAARTYNWERQAETYVGVYRALRVLPAAAPRD